MRHKWVKLEIGFLIAVMMLGTALFSIQAFTGSFQPETDASSAFFASPDIDGSPAADSDRNDTDRTAETTDVAKPQTEPASHSMDSNPEAKGFLAAPWIPASFIRQSMSQDVSFEKLNRLIRTYTIKSYPVDKTPDITDRNIRNMTNKGYHKQVLSMHIAKLTAG
ncbi:MAG: hypothetical protein ACYCYI_05425 [Saccharofermentanales bacterium]